MALADAMVTASSRVQWTMQAPSGRRPHIHQQLTVGWRFVEGDSQGLLCSDIIVRIIPVLPKGWLAPGQAGSEFLVAINRPAGKP